MRTCNLTVTLALVMFLALSAAACGGGGGGGGGSAGGGGGSQVFWPLPPNPTLVGGSPVKGQARTNTDLVPLALTSAPSDVPLMIDFSGDKNVLVIDKLRGRTTTIPISDFKIHNNGLITYLGRNNGEGVALILGGKYNENNNRLDLQYSNFGIWLVADNIGEAGGQSLALNNIKREVYFNMGVAAREARVKDSATFKGAAVANAYKSDPQNTTYVPLVGTASLNVSLLSLALDFPNFYNLVGSVKNSYGNLTGDKFTSITPNGTNTTGITLSQNPNDYNTNVLTVKTYGADPTDATEAVGGFMLEQEFSTSKSGIAGSYGLKKQ